MTVSDVVVDEITTAMLPTTDRSRLIGNFAAETVANLCFRRKVERVHSLGPRVTAELLAEIGAERGIRTVIDNKLEVYADLDPEAVTASEESERLFLTNWARQVEAGA